ncbi:translesion error-prone DNA polymerase V autoproteolytic subunit [Rhodocytophaga aerolata]|uniref:Translesion error-prone DNA polymerase V autoproteolytic subunit n=1 Tax=Rhodocytophaga aerolata TaxID=455078 RepID=A0ABT8R2K2_9BACT|nr:translesion error-prone DNA polymerase V autoproteolytic subunit [Rhodocytophaga aerolata]MDO1445508.1 translesion error-prone DNA polymerase V autoproteolytic subunit [Rhodocytophaga aerolata]
MQPFYLYYPINILPKKTLPLFACKVSAGFPSPANDYEEKPLNLHDYVVDNNSTTYFVKAEGNSMVGAGIFDGTVLVVDKSVEAKTGDIVVAFINGECFVKRLRYERGSAFLCPENEGYPVYEIKDREHFQIFGVVIAVCTKFNRKR